MNLRVIRKFGASYGGKWRLRVAGVSVAVLVCLGPVVFPAGATDVQALLSGIPQVGATLGKPTAPVTMEDYSDLECPICADFTTQTLPAVIQTDVRNGQLKIIFRSLQTATQSTKTFSRQQVAALAAGEQGLLWQYVFAFYSGQGVEDSGYATNDFLDSIAGQVPGLNLQQWATDRKQSTLSAKVKHDAKVAQELDLYATPTSIISGPGGKRVVVGAEAATQIEASVGAVATR